LTWPIAIATMHARGIAPVLGMHSVPRSTWVSEKFQTSLHRWPYQCSCLDSQRSCCYRRACSSESNNRLTYATTLRSQGLCLKCLWMLRQRRDLPKILQANSCNYSQLHVQCIYGYHHWHDCSQLRISIDIVLYSYVSIYHHWYCISYVRVIVTAYAQEYCVWSNTWSNTWSKGYKWNLFCTGDSHCWVTKAKWTEFMSQT